MTSVLSFGGGVNSTALLLGLVARDEAPSLVLFADTGSELPATYEHVAYMRGWCSQRGIPFEVATNAGRGQGASLEENCLTRRELPSLAYGFKGCSTKWKRQPMDRFVRDWQPAKNAWQRGEKVTRYIGIDAGERHRAVLTEDKQYQYQYPLVAWGWDRKDCLAAIAEAGIPQPPKSSCFFCPAMRKREILELQRTHPDLLQRALALEANAETHTVVGLGRTWRWADFLKGEQAQGKLFAETTELPCGCHDQNEEET